MNIAFIDSEPQRCAIFTEAFYKRGIDVKIDQITDLESPPFNKKYNVIIIGDIDKEKIRRFLEEFQIKPSLIFLISGCLDPQDGEEIIVRPFSDTYGNFVINMLALKKMIDIDSDLHYDLEERAGIKEFMANKDRETSEQETANEIL